MTSSTLPEAQSHRSTGHNAELDTLVTALFDAHATAICAYIHSLVRDWDLALDLTQESYLQLYRTRHRLPGVENHRAWIYRIASHVALNELKRRRRFAWLPWSGTNEHPQLQWHGPAEEVGQRDAVEQALAALPPHYRAPLLLFSSYGLSVREVADALEISQGAVKTRLHRAREMFRQAYDGDEK